MAELVARKGFELALCNGRITITSSRIPEYIGTFTRLIEMENKSAGRAQNLNPPKKISSDSIVMDQFKSILMGGPLRVIFVIQKRVRLRAPLMEITSRIRASA